MAELKRCLDTYVLIEVARGSARFSDLLNAEFVITDLTLAEFYAVLLREHNEKTADYWYKQLERYAVPVERSVLVDAVKFRYEFRKGNISFFDAVGYIFSLTNGYCFVTGDKEFASFRNVEFVKG